MSLKSLFFSPDVMLYDRMPHLGSMPYPLLLFCSLLPLFFSTPVLLPLFPPLPSPFLLFPHFLLLSPPVFFLSTSPSLPMASVANDMLKTARIQEKIVFQGEGGQLWIMSHGTQGSSVSPG